MQAALSRGDSTLGGHVLQTHTGVVCAGKSFHNSSTLMQQLQMHSGQKPFKCPKCGKGFLESATLVCHQCTHTGEKHYAYKDCG